MNKHTPAVIIGAGISGLRAASLLAARGIPCRVLEARGRIGGRVLSEQVEGRPDLGKFDLGPTWFWPQHEPIIAGLVGKLGLETFEQYNQGLILSERTRNEPPQRLALPGWAMESSVRLAGGVQTLVDAIAATLPEGTVELNARATSIRQEGDGSLTVEIEGRKEGISASAAILTLPPRIIARNIAFEPALPSDLVMSLMAKPTWMASQAKAVAIYERPFWREQGLCGFATSRAGPLQEIHDASPVTGAGALFGFFGISAEERYKLGEEYVLKLVEEQLTRLFGPLAKNKLALLYKDWAIDPETAVVEDAEPLREFPNYGPLSGMRNWDNKIVLAGTETAREQGGHLEGALRSADRAVFELLERFKITR